MPNKPTEFSLQTIKNLTLDTAVSPPIPREGILGKGGDGNWYNITVDTDGHLQIDILSSVLPTNAATEATVLSIDGKITTCNTGAIAGSVTANAGTNLNTSLLALETGGNLATIAGKDFATQTTLQAINAKMVTGTDIGDVTINNTSGANAVNIQDGGNTITVDGTVAVTGTFWQTTQPVSLASVPSHAVTNAGTFAVQENGAALTALQLVDNLTVAIDGNYLNVNCNIAGTDIVGGAGVVTAGVQRVTLASDDPAVTALQIIDDWDSGDTCKVTLQTGSNAIGKLVANSGVDIGDVDVASIATGTNAIGRVGHDVTGVGHGVKTVTTAGTDVVLATSTSCKKVDIQAQTDNTGLIAVGGSGVDATVATGTGIILNPGDTYCLEIDNLADIYIDATVNGEGVRFTYYT